MKDEGFRSLTQNHRLTPAQAYPGTEALLPVALLHILAGLPSAPPCIADVWRPARAVFIRFKIPFFPAFVPRRSKLGLNGTLNATLLRK